MATTQPGLADLIARHQDALLAEWIEAQQRASTRRRDLIGDDELERDAREFFRLLRDALVNGSVDPAAPAFAPLRDYLAAVSRSRAEAGATPAETAMFVFSFKQPLFSRLGDELADDAEALRDALWQATVLVDRLGLQTFEDYQRGREDVIHRQQQELIELSTPVVKLWEGVVAVPLIGTLDSVRTQVVMESLLETLVDTGSEHAIIDITGVPAVDTEVAQHLLKTVLAARLMGAECTISGVRPQIAQTIVALGIEFGDIPTKATLAAALRHALRNSGVEVVRRARPSTG